MADPNCDPNFGSPPAGPLVDDSPPDVSLENCICLRGPCRFLWQTKSRFDAMNNDGSNLDFVSADGDHVLKITKRLCTRLPGDPDPDITEERIYECSEWDPCPPEKADVLRHQRRERYFKIIADKGQTK
jgi:hypothetical protein